MTLLFFSSPFGCQQDSRGPFYGIVHVGCGAVFELSYLSSFVDHLSVLSASYFGRLVESPSLQASRKDAFDATPFFLPQEPFVSYKIGED